MRAEGGSRWEPGGRAGRRGGQDSPIHQSKDVEHGCDIRVATARRALQVLQCLLTQWHGHLIATLGCVLDHQVVQGPQPCWDLISTVLGALATGHYPSRKMNKRLPQGTSSPLCCLPSPPQPCLCTPPATASHPPDPPLLLFLHPLPGTCVPYNPTCSPNHSFIQQTLLSKHEPGAVSGM